MGHLSEDAAVLKAAIATLCQSLSEIDDRIQGLPATSAKCALRWQWSEIVASLADSALLLPDDPGGESAEAIRSVHEVFAKWLRLMIILIHTATTTSDVSTKPDA